jgi:hypothetical protein
MVMRKNDKLDPWILIGFGVIVIAIVTLAAVAVISIDGAQWGTVAEWFTGLMGLLVGGLAAFFAALAWKASERAAKAEEKASNIAELALNQQVKLDVQRLMPLPGLTSFQLLLDEASPPIWIKDIQVEYYGDLRRGVEQKKALDLPLSFA